MTRAAVALLALLAAIGPATAQSGKPKILAFVVGIERYDHAELDALQYAADDARAVYTQLGAVAELDANSRLLVADDAGQTEEQRTVTAQRLRDAIEELIPKIKNGTNVVVYLGGHGTLSPTDTLRYLPSDYDPTVPSRFVPFGDILNYFRVQIDGNQLYQTSVTFLVNMCGAGNAALSGPGRPMSVDVDTRIVEKARQLFREGKFGFNKYAILAATPKNRNAFERESFKASEFAHYLIEGLQGPAAHENGNITSHALLNYVSRALGGELPWSDEYADDIVIGQTAALEGEGHYLLGTGLLASAQSIVGGQRAALGSEEQEERMAQADLLYELSRDQLGLVVSRNFDLAPRSQLRLAQATIESEGVVDAAILEPLIKSDKLTKFEQQEVQTLLDAAPFSTFGSFRNYLKGGGAAFVAILRPADSTYDNGAHAWAELMKDFSGVVAREFKLDNLASLTPENVPGLSDAIVKWRKGLKQPSGKPHLIAIYLGNSGLEFNKVEMRDRISNRIDCFNLISNACQLTPVNRDFIIAIQELWGGSLTFIHDAPFGGLLLGHGLKSPAQIYLLLAAREPFGMTYRGRSGSTSQWLARAIVNDGEDSAAFQPLIDFQKNAGKPLSTYRPNIEVHELLGLFAKVFGIFSPGTPAWVADWGQLDIRPTLRPLGRFALQIAARCAEKAFADCDSVVGVGPAADGADVFDRLARAADQDLKRHAVRATNEYWAAAGSLRSGLMRLGNGPSHFSGDRLSETPLNMLLQNVERRAQGSLSKVGRRVVLVPVGIGDYTSPLVADLPHVAADLATYRSILSKMLSGSPGGALETTIAPPPSGVCGVPKNGALGFKQGSEMIACLKQAVADLNEQDLLLFIFSGRGVEIGGRRYLAMADAMGASAIGRDAALVDLYDIAAAAKGHWFVGIYDAQFSRPSFDPDRSDQILDKSIDSVRPRAADASQTNSERSITAERQTPARAQARGELPPRQIHLWVEGRLTQQAKPPLPCLSDGADLPNVASPFAAAILRTMTAGTNGTYRDWLNALAAHPCLQDSDVQTVVFQGDLDVPLFASGEGAEFVDYFHDQIARQDLNLRVAHELAADVARRFPKARNKLAQAALLVSLAQLHGEDAELHGFAEDRVKWLTDAIDLLYQIKVKDLEEDGDLAPSSDSTLNLWAIHLELLSRAYALGNKSDEALGVLREAKPIVVLGKRDLAQRMVRLSSEFLRRDPGVVLSFAREKLRSLAAESGASTEAMAELDKLILAERLRRSEPFRIIGPDPGSIGDAK